MAITTYLFDLDDTLIDNMVYATIYRPILNMIKQKLNITDEEIGRRGLTLNESHERHVREELRQQHGMAAYARLNLPRIDQARQQTNVVIDGLYSWEEYILLRDYYREYFQVVAVWASPQTRYGRLAARLTRPLTAEEADGRDRAEIENINKDGIIYNVCKKCDKTWYEWDEFNEKLEGKNIFKEGVLE